MDFSLKPLGEGAPTLERRPLLVALVVTCLGASLFLLAVHRFEVDRSGGPTVRLLVAKRSLELGHAITSDDVAVREVPRAYAEGRAIRAADLSKILHLRLGGSIETQEALLWTDLEIASPARRDLSSLVMPGHRAVYVRAMREDQGSALIRPGDYVDVIATFSEENGPSAGKTAIVLLQKALVLANGTYTSAAAMTADRDDKTRSPSREQGLTLSLSLQEAQLIALAADKGQFSVALRSPDDPRTIELLPDLTAAAMLDKDAHVSASATAKRPANAPVRLTQAPPRTNPYRRSNR
ncbi:MAG TPA: Flp pilus assembly protein CpaB [Polyangiaceae bacterium]|nr:Flp pilus assembly protein CpaB [Polyangiaceae bacterium]